jgi:hypothetical protein
MKKFIILIFFFLISCEIYNEPISLSLSGEYVITKVTLLNRENANLNQLNYYFGSHYINPNETFPVNDIQVGFTRWHFDYSVISFFPTQLGNGMTQWDIQYFYSIVGQYSIYDFGYIQFYTNDGFRTFKILEDGIEHLVLQTSNSNQIITLYLTRIGP